uniref:3-ketoacyl-CoA synthase 19-like n=1 Tax=Tanacetum cinerariifolium TaxID=118510 RepID=A0A6L2JQ04_TANCI|nr:3-ketoacyl-CoA synthase 19-like [Tanacetum cinerariifolium]
MHASQYKNTSNRTDSLAPIAMELTTTCILLFTISYVSFLLAKLVSRPGNTCYMIDYECYKGNKAMKLNTEECAKIVSRNKNLRIEDYKFLLQTMINSGLGEETYGPKNIISGEEEHPKYVDSLSEMEEVFFDTLDGIFARSNISPSDVDILVVNVSLLSPVPSLTSRIINHYKMREDVKAFNLSGMGCSASLVAIDVVQHLFKTQRNKLAIVVSSESMAANWYCGRERSMMLSNCLFRVGGCSMLLTPPAEVLPKRYNAIRAGSRSYLFSPKLTPTSSITALPPGWLGEETYGPKNIISGEEEHPKYVDSLSEMEEVFFETLDGIFAKSNISPSDVDILVVNVSLLSPVPSLTSRIINHYKMREDVKAFNLSGMGCSASLVAIDVVQHLFKTQRNKLAIVVSSESMAANWYCGRELSG